MSCIPKILELKGDKEFILTSINDEHMGIAIEGGGKYKNYDYLITLNTMGIRCGYVAIPSNHNINEFKEEFNFPHHDVHGGVTFFSKTHPAKDLLGSNACQDNWIGFDCGHGGDKFDLKTAKKYFTEGTSSKSIEKMIEINQLVNKEMEEKFPGYQDNKNEFETIKDFSYVEQECKNLIDQLIEATHE